MNHHIGVALLLAILSVLIVDGSNDCAYYGPTPANECGGYILELNQSYGYYCIDETTIEERWFNGQHCHQNELNITSTHSCDVDGCNCRSDNQCESVELIAKSCDGTEPSGIVVEIQKTVIGVCIPDGTTSGLFECDADGYLIDLSYLGDSQCDAASARTVDEFIWNNLCDTPTDLQLAYSSTCPVLVTSSEAPTSTESVDADICVPANVCMTRQTTSDVNLLISSEYICQSNGTVCLAVYSNGDCSDDAVDIICDIEEVEAGNPWDPAIISCDGCDSYMKIREYYINDEDTLCQNKSAYQEWLYPIGCSVYEVLNTSYQTKYECDSELGSFTSTFWIEPSDTSEQCVGDSISWLNQTSGCSIDDDFQPHYIELVTCMDPTDNPTSNPTPLPTITTTEETETPISTESIVSGDVCVPTNICMASKSFGQITSNQYICHSNGTRCIVGYANDDCSGNATSTICDIDGLIPYPSEIIDCENECDSYMKIRRYFNNETDILCQDVNTSAYLEQLYPIGCLVKMKPLFGISAQTKYECTSDSFDFNTWFEPINTTEQCIGDPIAFLNETSGCTIDSDSQVQYAEVITCMDPTSSPTIEPTMETTSSMDTTSTEDKSGANMIELPVVVMGLMFVSLF